MNILLVLGMIILLGTVGGKIFHKLKLPQVTGYLIIGLLLGNSFSGFLSAEAMDSFVPLVHLALGIIGFMIGSELRLDRFKRYSRSIYTILFVEGFLTFFLVCVVVTLFTKKLYMGLMLGALASATAPAATYSVLGEYKARGPVTMTTLSIVALDDALALLIYGFASVFAGSLISHETQSFMSTMAVPLIKIFISIFTGVIAGVILHKILGEKRDRERIVPFVLGTIILVIGSSIYFKVDPILASMVLGAVASNLQGSKNREAFDLVKKFSPPIFVLFFVLVGARLEARVLMNSGVFFLAIAYILSRSIGKFMGAYIGGKISGAKDTVTRYLGFCLFDQAGIAVGLAIAAFHSFSSLGYEARSAGLLILSVITATTFLLQLIAPPLIKYAIRKSDEINRDVTEQDVIEAHKVNDVMDRDFLVIKENNSLHQVIDIMKRSDAYVFPLTDIRGDFLGIISIGDIRNAFYEEQMDKLILAGDIVREIDTVICADQDLSEAMHIFERKNVDYIPVMEKAGSCKLAGQLEYRKVMDYITKEVLLRQRGVDG